MNGILSLRLKTFHYFGLLTADLELSSEVVSPPRLAVDPEVGPGVEEPERRIDVELGHQHAATVTAAGRVDVGDPVHHPHRVWRRCGPRPW